ncbi:MAG TPA: ABC transporter ATP-binding protein [Ferruginibacter sp.]|nr:ABC transporter ATP-binding protein [Ferruginibacter sp.]
MALLTVNGLHKKQGGIEVVKDVFFSQDALQKIAIAGEAGSGKTTLLKMIAGLIQPTAGDIFILDEKVKGPDEVLIAGHKSIAYLSQHFELRNNYRVNEILEMANRVSPQAANEIYAVCRITHLLQRRTDELSGGEKQRIALARLLITSPKLLLLDEPFSNLDAGNKKMIQSVIHDITNKIKMSCIMVSHDAADILSWADRVIVMKDGEIVQQATAKEIYRQPINEYCAGLLGEYNLLDLSDPVFASIAVNKVAGQKLLVRPEQILISRVGDDYAINGKVQEVFFKGNYYIMHVSAGEQLLIVQTLKDDYKKEDTIYLTIDPG